MDEYTIFTEEALKSQDGKKVPLKDEPGGHTIGEATIHYDEESGELRAKLHVTDPAFAAYLGQDAESVIFKKGN